MTEPNVACSICGVRLTNAALHAEQFIISPGEKVIGPQRHQRTFIGECPEHGVRLVSFSSEGHSTLLASKLANLFTRAERRALRHSLPSDDRTAFQAALNGQYAWDDSDVARWRAALGSPKL